MVVVVVVSGGLVVLGGLLVVVLLLLLLLGGGLPWESVSGGGSVQLGCCVCLCSVDVVQLDCSFFSGCGSARLQYLSLFTGCDSAGPLYLCSVGVIHLRCCICLCSVDVVQFTLTAISVFVQWMWFSSPRLLYPSLFSGGCSAGLSPAGLSPAGLYLPVSRFLGKRQL